MFVQLRGCFFSKQFHLHPPKSQSRPPTRLQPQKKKQNTCWCCDFQNLPQPHQTNKTNKTRHFLGFTKNRVEWKPPFHQVYGAADPFTPSEATPEAMDIHLGPGLDMRWFGFVGWRVGWRRTDVEVGEIKQKTLGGWRLLVMLVHGIRSDVFFYMTFVGGWQLNFGCLMLYLPQNGWFIIMENPIKMDDLGVPLFSETPIWYEQLYILDHWFLSFTQNRGRRCFSLSRNRGVFFTLSTFPF